MLCWGNGLNQNFALVEFLKFGSPGNHGKCSEASRDLALVVAGSVLVAMLPSKRLITRFHHFMLCTEIIALLQQLPV